jgi:hypothetical protein
MPPEESRSAPESPQVAARSVLTVALTCLGFLALSLAGLRAYYAWSLPGPVFVNARRFPEPRIGADTPAARHQREAAQRARLAGYGWVDKEHGLIRIPIERAMELAVARGSDLFAPLEAAPAAPDGAAPDRKPSP